MSDRKERRQRHARILFVESYLVTLLPEAQSCLTSQHPGIKFLHFPTGGVV